MDTHTPHRVSGALRPADPFALTVASSVYSLKRHAPYSRAIWLLPLLFGALGGVVAWVAVADRDEDAARLMLITGAVVQLVIGVAWMLTAAGGATFG